MSKTGITNPKQQRSIEKKRRIIEAGFKLFCEKGFHKTNTAEIAKEAGVSTGILYRYFLDKRAVFMECLPLFYTSFYADTYSEIKKLRPPFDFEAILSGIIDTLVAAHNYSKDAYGEMMAMSYSDTQVKEYFAQANKKINQELAEVLASIGLHIEYPLEKMHLIMDMIESYCHEVAFSRDDELDYGELKRILIQAITGILMR